LRTRSNPVPSTISGYPAVFARQRLNATPQKTKRIEIEVKLKTPCLIAAFVAACGLPLAAQMQPIQTGQFASGPAPVTLVLLNQSHLPDSSLADVANSLNRKTLGVVLATRLAGIGACGQGEWCLAITDQVLGNGSDAAVGASVGAEIVKEILRKMLSALSLQI
jgi:hypothetical protein